MLSRALATTTLAVALLCAAPALADRPGPLSPQTLRVPSGPSSLKGLGESFSADAASGSGSFSVPIELPPGPLAPAVQLSYSGGHGKSDVGLGWRLSRFRIYRTTDKGLPRFDELDRFGVEGPGLNDELVLVDARSRYYRLKNEGAFALFIRDSASDHWTVRLKSGEVVYLGETMAGRDANPKGTYRWYVERHEDQFGHKTTYEYTSNGGRRYLDTITYGLHAASDFHNRVIFVYEQRPDPFTDYTFGYAETTARRLSTIEVSQGTGKLRTYTLTYDPEQPVSLLMRVSMVGKGGLARPDLTLAYVKPSSQGRLTQMVSPPPVDGLTNGQATLEDVNGDGLPDLLVGIPGAYHYYENLDGVRWAEQPTMLQWSPEVGLAEPGVLLVDADGDGFRDLLYPDANAFRYASGGNIKDGLFRGYSAPVSLEPQSWWGFDWTSSLVKLSDLNFDGRIDLLYQRPGGLTQILNTETRQLEESVLPELPLDIDFSDARVQMLDFNGDGILDFVRREISFDQARVMVWYGRGWGTYMPARVMTGVPTGDPTEFYLQDVNGDGQTDLLRVSGSWVIYYLNDGNGAFGPAKGDYRGLPEASQTLKLLFADMNGNGTTDVVWLTVDQRIVYLDLTVAPFAGRLQRIDNGMGAVTTITYRSSTDYLVEAKKEGDPWHTPLIRPVPVISELRVSDSFEKLGLTPNEAVATYDYRDGYYDPKEREFRGFGEVAITKVGDSFHDTQVSRTWFHVGRDLETGEDQEVLKGKAYRLVISDAAGQILSTVETQWEARWLCQDGTGGAAFTVSPKCSGYPDKQAAKDSLVAFPAQVGAVQGAWGGGRRPVFTYSSWDYDLWGNTVAQASHGRVSFPQGHAVGQVISQIETAVGNDEVGVRTQFINNVDPVEWLIGLPCETSTLDLGGGLLTAGGSYKLLKSSRTYYDGEPYVGRALCEADHGKPSRETVWLEGRAPDPWIAVKRSRYYADGQLAEVRDALDGARELAYDDSTRGFPTCETIWVDQVGTTCPKVTPRPMECPAPVARLGQCAIQYSATYDTALGVMVSATDFNGNTTAFTYDGLGRLTSVIGPRDSAARPLHRYGYEWATSTFPLSTTTVEDLVSRENGTYTWSRAHADGLGRTRLTKTLAEPRHGYIASGWQLLSPQGKPTHVYENFASALPDFEPAPASTPVTITYFDGLDRSVMVYPPQVGSTPTYTSTVYLPLETRVYDELDTSQADWSFPAITATDGLGRVVDVIKYNDRDGITGEPAGPTELRWSVQYDPLGNIRSIVDPQGYARAYTYDSLARRRHIDDPNAGTVDLDYDDAGNLTSRTNALGERVTATYGRGNRLLETKLWRAGATDADSVYGYSYDLPQAELSDATNLVGQIARVTDSVGSVSWSYDDHGRVVAVSRDLWDPAVSSFTAQVRNRYRTDLALDAQGKPQTVSYPGGFSVAYGYNERGLVSGISGGFAQNARPIAPSVAYDVSGGLHRLDLYNSSVLDPSRGTTNCIWYDPRRRVEARKAGPTLLFEGDGCGDPNKTEASAFMHLLYSYTPHGLVETIRDPRSATPKDAYSYDRLYELLTATTLDGTASYRFNSIQNLVAQTSTSPSFGPPRGEFSYGQDGAGPNAITGAGGERFAYDAAGRLLNYRGFGLFYNAQDKLTSTWRADGTKTSNYYDFAGERVLEIVTALGKSPTAHAYPLEGYQVHDSDRTWVVGLAERTIAEVDETAGLIPTLGVLDNLVAYAVTPGAAPKPAADELLDFDGDGSSLDAADLDVAVRRFLGEVPVGPPARVWRYYHLDHLGAPAEISDSSGASVGHTEFHPFGPVRTQTGDQATYGFAGTLHEPAAALGLTRIGARWYAPDVGRWVSPDLFLIEQPARALGTLLEATSAYGYARNSPANAIDPTGQFAQVLPVAWYVYGFLLEAGLITKTVLDAHQAGKLANPRFEVLRGDQGRIEALDREEEAAEPQAQSSGAGARARVPGGPPECEKCHDLDKPRQIHHFASNKHSLYTEKFQAIASRYGLDLDGDWNKAVMPHLGRHPAAYHEFTYEGMTQAAREAGSSRDKFLELFDQYVKQPILENPDLLTKRGWSADQ